MPSPRLSFLPVLVSLVSLLGPGVVRPLALAGDVRIVSDVAYRGDDDAATDYARERCRLDLFLPEGGEGFATIVWFHGGSLQAGDKSGEMTRAIARRLAADGVAVAAVDYRLHPQVTFPVYVDDAAASVAWALRNITEHGGEPRRVFVSGHSAGGYLAAMVGLDPGHLGRYGVATERLAGVIPVSGQMVTHSTVREERGIPRARQVVDAAAPAYHVRDSAPPFLNVCGGDDLPARAEENTWFVAAMRAAGHEDITYLEVPGRDHGTIASGIADADDVVAKAILAFVAERRGAPEGRGREVAAGADDPPGHRVLVADSSRGRIAIIAANGDTEWEHEIGPLHDLHLLPNGHVLFQTDWTRIVEMDPETDEVVWEYDAKAADDRRVEVHAFERLPDGRTMIAESGRGRIIEVDRDGDVLHEIELSLEQSDPHHDTRLVRKLASGNYLVCHEAIGHVREYGPGGEVVWDYEVPLFGRERRGGHGLDAFGNAAFSALRLESGNTLIATGNGHSVIEVTPEKEVVWKLDSDDLPGIGLAWVTTLEVLPNGNIVLGNCHAGPENPQIVEVDRDRRVVWTYRDFERFGNALTNSQILDAGGKTLR